MSIKEFEYLDVAIAELEDKYDELEELSVVIQDNFFEILKENSIEFLNISARVKSPESLKEKILRNKYYKRYPDGNKLIYNLSDLIGVRIECRLSLIHI